MIGVVVKEEELFHFGKQSQRHDVVHATVAPADVRLVFRVVVSGVDDQHVGIIQELDDLLVLIAGVFEGFEPVGGRLRPRMRAHPLERLVVRQVGDHGNGGCRRPVTIFSGYPVQDSSTHHQG